MGTFHLCLFVSHLLKEFQLGNLTGGGSAGHFSTGAQKNLKSKTFIFSLKMAEMRMGVERGSAFKKVHFRRTRH